MYKYVFLGHSSSKSRLKVNRLNSPGQSQKLQKRHRSRGCSGRPELGFGRPTFLFESEMVPQKVVAHAILCYFNVGCCSASNGRKWKNHFHSTIKHVSSSQAGSYQANWVSGHIPHGSSCKFSPAERKLQRFQSKLSTSLKRKRMETKECNTSQKPPRKLNAFRPTCAQT